MVENELIVQQAYSRLKTEWRKAVVGQEEALDLLFIAMLVGGHVLFEGVPGTAKTLMARTLALITGGSFKRVQFTPDLMPSDITGTTVFDIQGGNFYLKHGPVFTDVLLADEVNRAPSKTQSALLEAMEEFQVTIDGTSHPLSTNFLVLATENPIEYEGTYPLPEAQLDRFLFKVDVPYMSEEQELELLTRYERGFDSRRLEDAGVQQVLDDALLDQCKEEVARVTVDDSIARYIVGICNKSRRSPDLSLGASPRAAVNLLLATRAAAALDGRSYVSPDDIKRLAPAVLSHRLIIRPEAQLEGRTTKHVVSSLLSSVEVPR